MADLAFGRQCPGTMIWMRSRRGARVFQTVSMFQSRYFTSAAQLPRLRSPPRSWDSPWWRTAALVAAPGLQMSAHVDVPSSSRDRGKFSRQSKDEIYSEFVRYCPTLTAGNDGKRSLLTNVTIIHFSSFYLNSFAFNLKNTSMLISKLPK